MAILNFFPDGDSSGSLKDLADAVVTLTPSSFTYDGTEKTQGITSVTYNGIALISGTDYILVADSNKATNAGTHTIFLVGMGNYSGIKTAEWSIAKAQGSISSSVDSVTVDNLGTVPILISAVGDGTVSYSSSNTNVCAISNPTDISVEVYSGGYNGTATLTASISDGPNYLGASCTISIKGWYIHSNLADNTVPEIKYCVDKGIASTLWDVGDATSEISIGSYGLTDNSTMPATTARAFILEFNHTDQGGTQSGITFQFGKIGNPPDCIDVAFYSSGGFRMQASDNWGPGWSGSRIRTIVIPNFINALPQEWQNVLSDTTISCRVGESWGTVTDKVFLLSVYEVLGHVVYRAGNNESDAAETVHTQYAYYQNGNSPIKYRHSSTSDLCNWWTRTRWHTGNSVKYFWCGIGGTGDCQDFYCASSVDTAFAPAFRIGPTSEVIS